MKHAQTISILQQKGGVGKSTMCQCIAAYVGKDYRVLILDTDSQQSCLKWYEESPQAGIDVIPHMNEDSLFDVIEKNLKAYDLILIDTAGYDSRMASYAIQISDLVMIPTKAGKRDIEGAAKTWKHVKNLTANSKNPCEIRIVFWGVKKIASVTQVAFDAVNMSELPVLQTRVADMTGFEVMQWNGGMPTGAAERAARSFIAAMQIENLLKCYAKVENVA